MKNTWLVLLLILILQFTLRAPFISMPLEPGDEGLYAYFAQRISAGAVLYRDMQDVKPPGIFYIYLTAFKVLGEKESSIRLFSIMFAMLTTIFMFLIGKQIANKEMGLISALLFAIFSSGVAIDGVWGTVEGFMALPMVIAFYCFLRGMDAVDKAEKEKGALFSETGFLEFFLTGLFSSLAVMIKQVALFNFIALLIMIPIVSKEKRQWLNESFIALSTGFVFPLILIGVYFYFKSAFVEYVECVWFCSIGIVRPSIIISILQTINLMIRWDMVIWLFALIGAMAIIKKRSGSKPMVLLIWWAFSIVGVFSVGYALAHYYLQIIPGLCLMSGYTLCYWNEINIRKIIRVSIYFMASLSVISMVVFNYEYCFYRDPRLLLQLISNSRNGVIAEKIGEKMKNRPNDSQYIISENLRSVFYYAKKETLFNNFNPVLVGNTLMTINKKILFEEKFSKLPKESVLNERNKKMFLALADKRTSYYLYLKGNYVPPDIDVQLRRNNYVIDRELSYPSEGIIVFRHEK